MLFADYLVAVAVVIVVISLFSHWNEMWYMAFFDMATHTYLCICKYKIALYNQNIAATITEKP